MSDEMKQTVLEPKNCVRIKFSEIKASCDELLEFADKNHLPVDAFMTSVKGLNEMMSVTTNSLCFNYDKIFEGLSDKDKSEMASKSIVFFACYSAFYAWFEKYTKDIKEIMGRSK